MDCGWLLGCISPRLWGIYSNLKKIPCVFEDMQHILFAKSQKTKRLFAVTAGDLRCVPQAEQFYGKEKGVLAWVTLRILHLAKALRESERYGHI